MLLQLLRGGGNDGHYLTPLVFSVSGSTYTLAAVYQSIQVSQTGSNTEPLSLIGGSLSPNTTYVFGFCNQQVENTGTQGSPVLAWANSNSGTIPLSPADDPGALITTPAPATGCTPQMQCRSSCRWA